MCCESEAAWKSGSFTVPGSDSVSQRFIDEILSRVREDSMFGFSLRHFYELESTDTGPTCMSIIFESGRGPFLFS